MATLFLAGLVDLIIVMAPTFIVMTGIGLTFPNYYGIAVGVFTDEMTGVANALIGALVLVRDRYQYGRVERLSCP